MYPLRPVIIDHILLEAPIPHAQVTPPLGKLSREQSGGHRVSSKQKFPVLAKLRPFPFKRSRV